MKIGLTSNVICNVMLWKIEQGIINWWGSKKFLRLALKWDELGKQADRIEEEMSVSQYRGSWERRMFNELILVMKKEGIWA